MKYAAVFILSIFLISCSSDDVDIQNATKNYLPIDVGHEWTYERVATINGESDSGTDVTTMTGTTTIDGISYTEWDNVNYLFGFSNSIFTNKEGDVTFFKIPDIDLGFGEAISLEPFAMIDDNSSAGTTLASIDLEQQFAAIPIDTLGFAGTITPVIFLEASSVHATRFDNVTLNGTDEYEDVYKNESSFFVQVDLVADLTYEGFPLQLTHTWLPMQEYAVLETWFVHDIGLARSVVEIGISEVDSTVDIPIVGELDLEEFGIDFEDYIDVDDARLVSELIDYTL